jgi:hypothetical protein
LQEIEGLRREDEEERARKKDKEKLKKKKDENIPTLWNKFSFTLYIKNFLYLIKIYGCS